MLADMTSSAMSSVSPDSAVFPDFTPTSGEAIRWTSSTFGANRLAVRHRGGGVERLTFADAATRSAELAKALLASGVGKGTHVGVLAPNGPDWIVAMLAVSRIGAVAVLLNTYNKAGELAWVLRHADVQVLLTVDHHLGHDYLDRLEAAVPDLDGQCHERILVESHPFLRAVWAWSTAEPSPDRCWVGRHDALLARAGQASNAILTAAEAEVSPADAMTIVYTSGSTSVPKGVVHGHGAAFRHACNLNPLRELTEADVLYCAMPLFWIGGLSYALTAAMMCGATLVFHDQFEPGAALDIIERERVTIVLGWPHLAKALADHPTFAGRDLSSLRTPIKALFERDEGPAVPVASSLGMTETLGPHTYGRPADPPPATDSYGRSIPGIEHKVIDPFTAEDLPPGSEGEICVRGYSLMLGLYKRERADAFTVDGWLRTGDRGWFDTDGHLHFQGRMGDVIKTSGMNVAPRDVELALEASAEVALAFVTGIPHPERGEDVVAGVILQPGATVDPDELRARVKDAIASYKVPRHVVVLDGHLELPLLDSGKVDRRRLAAILCSRVEQP